MVHGLVALVNPLAYNQLRDQIVAKNNLKNTKSQLK